MEKKCGIIKCRPVVLILKLGKVNNMNYQFLPYLKWNVTGFFTDRTNIIAK